MRYELYVSTRKGLFIGRASADRATWALGDPLFPSWSVDYATRDLRTGRIWASVSQDPWGPHLHYSDDDGENWEEAGAPTLQGRTRPAHHWNPNSATFESVGEQPASVQRIWTIEPGAPGVLYAGTDPAALFRSDDNGATWELCEALWDHESRDAWFPGTGGLILHHIMVDPRDACHLYAAVSAAGVFESSDDGKSWSPRNDGTSIPYLPPGQQEADVGQCVHGLAMCTAQPDRLYQQNHDGIYRSDDAGANWIDISEGLPARFGFTALADPRNPDTFYVVPMEADENRVPPEGRLRVFRTQDAGASWQALGAGLPQTNSYCTVLRQALACDAAPEGLGLYFGTGSGEVYASVNGGEEWRRVADHLASVNAVRAVALG